MNHVLTEEVLNIMLQEDFLRILGDRPLDDVVDALAEAFRRRAGDISNTEDGEAYRNTALELDGLKARDFALSDDTEVLLN